VTAPVQRKLPGTMLIPGEQLVAEWQDDISGPPSEVSAGRTGQVRAHILPTIYPRLQLPAVIYSHVFQLVSVRLDPLPVS
jgi:hypothetical protein